MYLRVFEHSDVSLSADGQDSFLDFDNQFLLVDSRQICHEDETIIRFDDIDRRSRVGTGGDPAEEFAEIAVEMT